MATNEEKILKKGVIANKEKENSMILGKDQEKFANWSPWLQLRCVNSTTLDYMRRSRSCAP